ncbi:MAG: hypothetical protein EA362_05515 [Saprospirales bacterium]|nr:MAG: hypothetical protein EA362_05515 [Saprospirales bacterium]
MGEKGILISKDHLIVFSNQYPIAEIERASIYANHTSYRGPFFLCIMGLLFTIGHLITGVIIMGAAVIWGLSIRKKYSLILTMDGKEKSVLVHHDKKVLEELLKAIGDLKGKS